MADIEEKVLTAIRRAIQELNRELDEERRLETSRDSALFGRHSNLDSYGLVSLIVVTEQEIEDLFGVTLTLADDRAVSQERSPFLTVGSFADYIRNRLEDEGHD
jgi:acyl carrier protein